jgi:hypothetical protein
MENEIDDSYPGPLTDYNEAGIDMTLVREPLAITPAERLQVLQEMMNSRNVFSN